MIIKDWSSFDSIFEKRTIDDPGQFRGQIPELKKIIALWERDKGNTKHRDIDFLRWYEKNVEFDPIILKVIEHNSYGEWIGIPYQEIHDYFIELVDSFDVDIYIAKGAISKDTFLTLEFLTDDVTKFKGGSELHNKIIEMSSSLGRMYDKSIYFYKFDIDHKGIKNNPIVFFYFRCE